MLISFLLLALCIFMAMVASKKRRTIKARTAYQREMDAIRHDLDVLLKLPKLSTTQQEQVAFLRNRLAFAKQHPPDKYIV